MGCGTSVEAKDIIAQTNTPPLARKTGELENELAPAQETSAPNLSGHFEGPFVVKSLPLHDASGSETGNCLVETGPETPVQEITANQSSKGGAFMEQCEPVSKAGSEEAINIPQSPEDAAAVLCVQSEVDVASQPQLTEIPKDSSPPAVQRPQGISLEFLSTFCQDLDATYGKGMKTCDVVQSAIKPRTSSKKCRYTELIPMDMLDRPSVFISHGWDQPFTQQMTKVFYYVQLLLKYPVCTYVWLDIFAVNQHPGEEQQTDLLQLQDMIRSCGTTLLLLDEQGIALTRIWVLFEIWKTTCSEKTHLFIVGPLKSLLKPDLMKQVWFNLDVAKAQATVESDRVRILSAIEESVGTEELNHIIKNAILGSARAETKEKYIAEVENSPIYVNLLQRAAILEEVNGNLSQSVELFELAWEKQKQISAPLQNLVYCVDHLATHHPNPLSRLRYFQEALHITILSKQEDAIYKGDRLFRGVDKTNSVGDIDQIREYWEQDIDYSNPTTTLSYFLVLVGLTGVFISRQMESQLQIILEKAIYLLDHKILSDVPEPALTIFTDVLLDPAKTLGFYQQILQSLTSCHGPDHVDVAWTLVKIGRSNYGIGKVLEAIQSFVKAENIYLKNGSGPLDLVFADLGTSWSTLGNLDKAIKYFELAIEKRPSGSDVQQGQNHLMLAQCLTRTARFSEASGAFAKAMDIFFACYGEDCPQFAEAFEGLEFVSNQLGKPEEAQQTLERVRKENQRVLLPLLLDEIF